MPLDSRRSYALPRIQELPPAAEREADRALALWLETVALVLIIIGLALLFIPRQERPQHSSSVYLIHMSGEPLHVSGDCITYNRST